MWHSGVWRKKSKQPVVMKSMIFLDPQFETQFDELVEIEMYKKGVFALPGMNQYGFNQNALMVACDGLGITYTNSDSKTKLSTKIGKKLLVNYKKKYHKPNAFDKSIKKNIIIWKAYLKLKINYEKCIVSSDKSKKELANKIRHTVEYKRYQGSDVPSKACHVQKEINIAKFEKKYNVVYEH